MKRRKRVISLSISVLVGLMLLVLAFFPRGDLSGILLATVAGCWLLFMVGLFIYRRGQAIGRGAKKVLDTLVPLEPVDVTPSALPVQAVSSDAGGNTLVLHQRNPGMAVDIRHCSYRITDMLRSAYPEARWSWEVEHPEEYVLHGGTARIRTDCTGEYNHADITLGEDASISIAMLRLQELRDILHPVSREGEDGQAVPPMLQNIAAWWDLRAQKQLTDVITDLKSRGHKSLYINETGDVLIVEGAGYINQLHLENLPERQVWPQLCEIIAKDGTMQASQVEANILVSWA